MRETVPPTAHAARAWPSTGRAAAGLMPKAHAPKSRAALRGRNPEIVGLSQSRWSTARTPAAPDDGRLWLLRSSPDQVHGPPVHRARPSIRGTGWEGRRGGEKSSRRGAEGAEDR